MVESTIFINPYQALSNTLTALVCYTALGLRVYKICRLRSACVYSNYYFYIIYCNLFVPTVISEPRDVAICKGKSTTFTCLLDSSISSDDVKWYRLIGNASTTERVNQSHTIRLTTSTSKSTLNGSLTIINATKSRTGYYWVRLPSDDVCNVSLTVDGESMQLCYVIVCSYTYEYTF